MPQSQGTPFSLTPHIQIHGGVGTIGGTKVIVQEGPYRVLFDFGTNYAPGGDFWAAHLKPREGDAGLRDLVTLGYLPQLDGLYRSGAAARLGLVPGGDERTHVFISHLHLDHMSVVDKLADTVPVWMHHDSLRLFRAIAETGERPALPAGARGFAWGEEISVGPMRVTPVAIDHDIPGAGALLIETSAGVVAYTGDLRLHGSHPEYTTEFMHRAAGLRPKVLLIEGTRLGEAERSPDWPPSLSEPGVAPRVVELLQGRSGLGLITLYPRNTIRIASIAAALAAAGRKLVLSPETAHIYAAMGGDLSGLAVYRRDKDTHSLERGLAPHWLSTLLGSGATVVDAGTVSENQGQYLLQLFHWDLGELVDLRPAPGSVFIHSNGEPLGKFDPAYELFTRWLARFDLELVYASSTGHAPPADLERVVAEVRPEVLMTIHSRMPELLDPPGIRRLLPELGAAYDIATCGRLDRTGTGQNGS